MAAFFRSGSDTSSSEASEACLDDYLAAIRGEKLLSYSVLHGYAEASRSVVHGIRHHQAFANSAEVLELIEKPDDKRHDNTPFKRARIARLIMSNIVPEFDSSNKDLIPYCIWHPDLATEGTYREVARRYICLRYQVGRACAVAGYTALYRELDLLPDISIAEEARESAVGGDIFKDIEAQPVRYAVMNDYAREIRHGRLADAGINGDTAVLSMLKLRRLPNSSWGWNRVQYFDISEDDGIDDHDTEVAEDPATLRSADAWLLYSPLPKDLPAINKDLLILMAAYEGSVDRYTRLRRPVMGENELVCAIRGIYHNTTFAKWWSIQLEQVPTESFRIKEGWRIRRAVYARFTMINDLSWLQPGLPEFRLPYLIWYPLKPDLYTLEEIVRREPRMILQVAHACIACQYRTLYDELQVRPSPGLLDEATHCPNKYYLEDLEAREKTQGPATNNRYLPFMSFDEQEAAAADKEPTTTLLRGSVDPSDMCHAFLSGLYDGCQADSSLVELFMCSPEKLREKAAASEDGCLLLIDA